MYFAKRKLSGFMNIFILSFYSSKDNIYFTDARAHFIINFIFFYVSYKIHTRKEMYIMCVCVNYSRKRGTIKRIMDKEFERIWNIACGERKRSNVLSRSNRLSI